MFTITGKSFTGITVIANVAAPVAGIVWLPSDSVHVNESVAPSAPLWWYVTRPAATSACVNVEPTARVVASSCRVPPAGSERTVYTSASAAVSASVLVSRFASDSTPFSATVPADAVFTGISDGGTTAASGSGGGTLLHAAA
ncbi:MAG TPA: hypothetical protein VGD80_23400 [Kofleriaceae bacterium]